MDAPTPTALLSPRALSQYVCLPRHPEGPSCAGPGLLCELAWSAAPRSEGNKERGRRGGCRLPLAVALRLLGAVAPWGSSRRCYASLWALLLNRLSLSTTPLRVLMDVAQSGRSSADRLDGWTDNPSSYVTAEGED